MEVTINSLNHEGKGIARIDNKIVFIPNALPGEKIKIKIIKSHKNFDEGLIEKYIETSPDRQTPICPYYGECGGCDIMHMNYTKQVEFKIEKVKNILKKFSNIDIEPIVIKSDKELRYRNKITLHYKNNKLGYMKAKTNEIIEINSCPLVMDYINKEINKLTNSKTDIIIRENTNGQIISSIENNKMIENINEYKFQIDTKSFFQVNNYICSKIFEIVEQNIEPNTTCLDLYSGVGTLSIVASKNAKFVYSIEINEHSHKNALENLKLNKIKNIKFILGDVSKEIKKIKEKINIIITDPPRKGMDKSTIDIIKELSPDKLIYISCNPMTLARDINLLNNYELTKIYTLDMFPNTHHVECACILNKKELKTF